MVTIRKLPNTALSNTKKNSLNFEYNVPFSIAFDETVHTICSPFTIVSRHIAQFYCLYPSAASQHMGLKFGYGQNVLQLQFRFGSCSQQTFQVKM